jgi:hypothetical protein
MATLNFPTSPSVNQTYTIGDQTWIWTGSAWIKLTSSPQTPIVINTITNSTSTITGSIVIGGGLGVGGSVNIGQTSTIAGAQIITTATLNNYVNQPVIAAGTGTAVSSYVSSATEYILIWSTATLQDVTDRGTTTTNVVRVANTTNATSTVSGALVVSGGAAIGGDLWLGGTLYSGGLPVITTSSLIESIAAGPDILVTATQGLLTGTIAIIISNTSTLQTVTGRGSTTTNQVTFGNTVHVTDTTESVSSSTGAVIISGGLGVAKRINSESLQIADTIMDSGMVLVNTTGTIVVDAYSVDLYRSAKYLIQITEGTGVGASFETIEILLLVDNNQTVFATEYAVLSSNGDLGEFAADVQGDNMVRLYFTAFQATDKILKIFRTGMTV